MKIIIIILVVTAIVGGSLYILSLMNKKPNIAGQSKLDAPISLLLTMINNQIQVKGSSADKFIDVSRESMTVEQGSHIKTSLTGRGILESENETTTVIDKNSEIIVARSSINKSKIELETGNLWSRVEKVFGQGEYYQVETNNAVATVRGTAFGVFYTKDKTVIMVTENQVWVLSFDPNTKQPIDQEVIVGQGQKATIITGYAPVIESITELDKKSEWYLFNQGAISPTPTARINPAPSSGPQESVTPTLTPTPTPTPTPPSINQTSVELKPTPTPSPAIYSVTPKTIYTSQGSADFFINGENLAGARQLFLSDISIKMFAIDSQTIGGTVTQQIEPGVYNVTVVLSTGEKLVLPEALTVRYE